MTIALNLVSSSYSNREKGETIRQKLDEEFSSLQNLLYAVLTATTAGDASPEQDRPAQPAVSDPPKPKAPEDELLLASQDLGYDQNVRELAFDGQRIRQRPWKS